MKQAPCPTCHKTVARGGDNPYQPFCSEKCKLIDLGAWLTERYSIAGQETGPGDPDDESPERYQEH